MGIEPTGHTRHVRPNGFEDRGHHQVCKHFRTWRTNLLVGQVSKHVLLSSYQANLQGRYRSSVFLLKGALRCEAVG